MAGWQRAVVPESSAHFQGDCASWPPKRGMGTRLSEHNGPPTEWSWAWTTGGRWGSMKLFPPHHHLQGRGFRALDLKLRGEDKFAPEGLSMARKKQSEGDKPARKGTKAGKKLRPKKKLERAKTLRFFR